MITARTSWSASAARAASASSAVTWSFSALTFGGACRMVPRPAATSRRTKSPRGLLLTKVAVGHSGRGLGVGDQAELGAAVQQPVIGQDADRVAERPRPVQRHFPGVADRAVGGLGGLGGQG